MSLCVVVSGPRLEVNGSWVVLQKAGLLKCHERWGSRSRKTGEDIPWRQRLIIKMVVPAPGKAPKPAMRVNGAATWCSVLISPPDAACSERWRSEILRHQRRCFDSWAGAALATPCLKALVFITVVREGDFFPAAMNAGIKHGLTSRGQVIVV